MQKKIPGQDGLSGVLLASPRGIALRGAAFRAACCGRLCSLARPSLAAFPHYRSAVMTANPPLPLPEGDVYKTHLRQPWTQGECAKKIPGQDDLSGVLLASPRGESLNDLLADILRIDALLRLIVIRHLKRPTFRHPK